MSAVRVWGADASFDAAIAQLPGRVERTESPRGALCVVDGRRDGPDRLLSLRAEAAAALIVTSPAAARRSLLDELERERVPVIVDRPFLRGDEDAAAAGGAAFSHVLVDVVSGRADFRAAVTDAVGWARIAVGGALEVTESARTADALLGALRQASGIGAALTATRVTAAAGPAFRVSGLGATRLEVEIDVAAGVREIRVLDEAGTTLRPPRYEDRRRLVLRRALAALDGSAVSDLAELRHDRAIAEILAGGSWP